MSWQQEGFLVLSDARGMPLFHGFFLPRWEAERKLEEVQKLPQDLSYGATIVPARLWFDWRGTPRVISAHETAALCDDCPPVGYPTDKTRCAECPRMETPPARPCVWRTGCRHQSVCDKHDICVPGGESPDETLDRSKPEMPAECSSLCHPSEPCSITEDGTCDARPEAKTAVARTTCNHPESARNITNRCLICDTQIIEPL